MTSIHKEALAEAKKLREIAENNAKKAILEHISPTIKNMIDKELLGESTSDVDEDVLISPQEKEEEKKEKGEKEETSTMSENDDIHLTKESVEALAKLAGSKAEGYGLKVLKLSDRLEEIHNSKNTENAYMEKLNQVKTEIELSYKKLQEDKKIIPENAINLIEGKFNELYETTNNLYIPTKIKIIGSEINNLLKKVNQYKFIAEEYGLKKEAQKVFGKKCLELVENTKNIKNSINEVSILAEDKRLQKFSNKVASLFEEIKQMAKQHGALNEEELKLVISGLNTEDPEGSALTATVEPADEDMGDMDMDDMSMDDDMDSMDDLEDLGAEDEVEEMDMYERELDTMELNEDELNELLGKTYSPGASSGRAGLAGSRSRAMRKASKEKEDKKEDKQSDELQEDEVIEISEHALKRELAKLRARRRINEGECGDGPGSLDNFGGATRQLGGEVRGEMFTDEEDLNELDPVGTGFSVNENEELNEDELNELLGKTYSPGKSSGRAGLAGSRSRAMRKASKEDKKEDKEEDKEEAVNESARLTRELVETLRTYKSSNNKLREKLNETEGKLRNVNLFNAKLVAANKLLQNENLTPKQRVTVIETLDGAETVKEVKKLYTGLNEALSSNKEKITEGAKRSPQSVMRGGSSRPTKKASTLTEGEQKEFSRWGQLAGILED